MLRGIDVGKFYKTLKESFLISGYLNEFNFEDLKFQLMLKSILLNKKDNQSVLDLHQLFGEYADHVNPQRIKERTSYAKSVNNKLTNLLTLEFKGSGKAKKVPTNKPLTFTFSKK